MLAPMRAILISVLTTLLCATAFADQTYTIHENLRAGEVATFHVVSDDKSKTNSTTNGVQTNLNTDTIEDWTVTLTVLDQKNGSSLRSKAEIDSTSFDGSADNGGAIKKTPCPYAGKAINLSRHPDETFSDDFSGSAGDDDSNLLDNFMTPDEDFYPDHPIAVGQTFDCSDKVAKHSDLGPTDKLIAIGRLDWVKTINGRQMAQISVSVASAYHETGHIEEDVSSSLTLLVDIAAGMIVKSDQTGSSKYSTAPGEVTQLTGGTEFTFHADMPRGPATMPDSNP
jgi:hypothetical protein